MQRGTQLRYKWVQSDGAFPVSMGPRMHLKCSLQLTLGQTMWALFPGDSCKEELGSSDWQTSHNDSNPQTAGYQPHRLVRFLFLQGKSFRNTAGLNAPCPQLQRG